MEFISIAEARANFASVIDEVAESKNPRVINRNGKPAAVLVDFEQYESMNETLEILADPEEAAELLYVMNHKHEIEWHDAEEVAARMRAKWAAEDARAAASGNKSEA